jgi:hypothetical protein
MNQKFVDEGEGIEVAQLLTLEALGLLKKGETELATYTLYTVSDILLNELQRTKTHSVDSGAKAGKKEAPEGSEKEEDSAEKHSGQCDGPPRRKSVHVRKRRLCPRTRAPVGAW